jgi:hypothetical protein
MPTMKRSPRIATLIAWMALAGLCAEARAQDDPPDGEEFRYRFEIQAAPNAYDEKLLLERFAGLDPEMHADIDRELLTLKVLAYRPLEPSTLIAQAADAGLIMTVACAYPENCD